MRNGDKMVSNNRNTAPQPLVQPPADNAKANTPAPIEQEFSQQFKCTSESGEPVAKARYKIYLEDGQIIEGATNAQGLTQRVYTETQQNIKVDFGGHSWMLTTRDEPCC